MAKQAWHTVTDVAAFLRGGRKVSGAHAFTGRVLHWTYCTRCGLMLLKNDETRREASRPCVTLED